MQRITIKKNIAWLLVVTAGHFPMNGFAINETRAKCGLKLSEDVNCLIIQSQFEDYPSLLLSIFQKATLSVHLCC